MIPLRAPLLFNLRTDPFERAQHEAGDYERWFVQHIYLMAPAAAFVAKHLQTYRDFPPRQAPGSFSIDQAMRAMRDAMDNGD